MDQTSEVQEVRQRLVDTLLVIFLRRFHKHFVAAGFEDTVLIGQQSTFIVIARGGRS